MSSGSQKGVAAGTELPGVDARLAAELHRWHAAEPGHEPDGLTLAWLVTARVRAVGRHHLGEPLLTALADVHRRHRDLDPFLDAFLDAVLARHQDRFLNQTYLALPLLRLILNDPDSGLDPVRLSAVLMGDVVGHELRPESAVRLDPRTRATRVLHAARFITEAEPTVHVGVPAPPGTAAAEWLRLTVLPVSTVHDEYFFIRALQTHELVFETLTELVRAAVGAVRVGQLDRATLAVRRADNVFRRAAVLFRVVATMRAADFHEFREYTDGASAIQSEAYKRFELACGSPSPSRLESEAFTSVPGVRPGPDDLTRAYADLGQDVPQLSAAMAGLESSHQRWKTAHHGLAQRMLGDARGSGYSAGVPYLRRCLDNRLFRIDAERRAA